MEQRPICRLQQLLTKFVIEYLTSQEKSTFIKHFAKLHNEAIIQAIVTSYILSFHSMSQQNEHVFVRPQVIPWLVFPVWVHCTMSKCALNGVFPLSWLIVS